MEETYDKFPRKGGSSSGSEIAYSVEARYNYSHAEKFGALILDKRWTRINFEKTDIGVPNTVRTQFSTENNLLSWVAANALRWWFLSSLGFSGTTCVETRIVKHVITYSFSEEITSAHHVIGGEDRSSSMPDWSE